MSCRADEIAKLDKKISDLREYDKICKQRKEHLNNTTQIIDEILSEVYYTSLVIGGVDAESLTVTFTVQNYFPQIFINMVL